MDARGIIGRRVVYCGARGVVAAVISRGAILKIRVGRARIRAPRDRVKFVRGDYTTKPGA